MHRVPCEKMKNSELKKYLNGFPDDAPISVILANPRKRKLYEVKDILYIADMGQPVFCIDVEKEKDMDAEMVAVCKESEEIDGQMSTDDFEEWQP